MSIHAILDIVFELVDEERTDPSNESNSNKGSKGETTMESHFNDTNISEELKNISPPQQSTFRQLCLSYTSVCIIYRNHKIDHSLSIPQ